MNLSEHYQSGRLAVSFELFPPKTEEGMAALMRHVDELAARHPSFITCTYGAGGSTRDKTLEVLEKVSAEYPKIPVASHLTCVGATKDDLRDYLRRAQAQGIRYIVALRGDPPRGETDFKPVEGGLAYGNEMVALVRQEFPAFDVIVAGYPETHPEATSPDDDLRYLKQKVDAGADVVVTQLFYDNEIFFRFRDRCVKACIEVPIVPGLLPIVRREQIKPDKTMFGSRVPDVLIERMNRYENDEEGQFAAGVYFAGRQVDQLVEAGVPGVHFYVLNKSRAAAHICRALALGMPPA